MNQQQLQGNYNEFDNPYQQQKNKKPFYKKWWFWLIIIVLIVSIGNSGSSDKENAIKKTKETEKDEEVIPYSKEIELIDMNINDTFKGKNHFIEIEKEEGDYKVSIAFHPEDDRFSESIWCGVNSLSFLKDMKKHQPDLDKNINTYVLMFFTDDSQTFSTKVDNTDSAEIKKIDLISEATEDIITITDEDIEKFYAVEKERKEKEEKYNTGITVEDMARDRDGLKDSFVTFSGTIIQVVQGKRYNQYRMAVNDDYNQVILVEISNDKLEINILEDDFVTIQGVSFGNVEYKTVLGDKRSIPGVRVDNFTID